MSIEILSRQQKEWLRAMPSWSVKDCNGTAIITRCKEVEEMYEFDVQIPMAEMQEHIQRLQQKVRELGGAPT